MSSKKLSKKVLTANLLALAAVEIATDADHRDRFESLLERIRRALATAEGPEVIHQRGLGADFAEARHIAKEKLRMSPKAFESTVADLNTQFSRVVNTCPTGKDPRDLPDYLKMPDDEANYAYELRTPYDAVFFIVRHGKTWGFSAAQILKADVEFRLFEKVRRAKLFEEDEARRIAESARIAARPKSGYLITTYRDGQEPVTEVIS